MKTSEALKITKSNLRSSNGTREFDKYTHICNAAKVNDEAGKIVVPIIKKGIEGMYTFEEWFYKTHPQYSAMRKAIPEYAEEKIQDARHNWLNSLIAYYKSIND